LLKPNFCILFILFFDENMNFIWEMFVLWSCQNPKYFFINKQNFLGSVKMNKNS